MKILLQVEINEEHLTQWLSMDKITAGKVREDIEKIVSDYMNNFCENGELNL